MGGALRSHTPITELDAKLAGLLQDEQLPRSDGIEELLEAARSPLTNTWPRTWMVGMETSTVLGGIGLRAEGAWLSHQVVQQAWLQGDTTPTTSAGLGLDWAHGTDLQVTLEGRWIHMLAPPDDLILALPDDVQLGGLVRVGLARGRVTLTSGGLLGLGFEEGLVRTLAQWRVSDAVEIEVGTLFVVGSHEPPDDLRDAVSYSHGPWSYFSDNDCFTLGLTWIL
jgi:hypothetical protein